MHDDGVTVFTAAFPIIITPDLGRALGFYRDLLDAEVEYQFPAEGDPAYVGLAIGDTHLGIARDPDAEAGPEGQRLALWVYAASCDAAVERLRSAGAAITEEPTDQPWGERVAHALDPDGNEVIIGERG
jgi:lactoylglutathione lyase